MAISFSRNMLEIEYGRGTAIFPDNSDEIFKNRKEKDIRKLLTEYTKAFYNITMDTMQIRPPELLEIERDIYMHTIEKAVSFLYGEKDMPKNIIETGSAGNISAALAFPDSNILAIDIDRDVFINEINFIPQEFFDKIGFIDNTDFNRITSYYDDYQDTGLYYKLKEIVKLSIPNYERIVADGYELPIKDDSIGLAIAYGTPDMIDIGIKEFSRVVKPGCYITSIVIGELAEKGHPSFYDTGEYNVDFWKNYHKIDPKIEGLPLSEIDVPDELKDYERIAKFMINEKLYTAGITFELFKKL